METCRNQRKQEETRNQTISNRSDRKMTRFAATLVCTMILCSVIAAQDEAKVEPQPVETRLPIAKTANLSAAEISLSIGLLGFGLAIVLLQVIIMIKQNKYWVPWSFRIVGLTLVLTVGCFLIV